MGGKDNSSPFFIKNGRLYIVLGGIYMANRAGLDPAVDASRDSHKNRGA